MSLFRPRCYAALAEVRLAAQAAPRLTWSFTNWSSASGSIGFGSRIIAPLSEGGLTVDVTTMGTRENLVCSLSDLQEIRSGHEGHPKIEDDRAWHWRVAPEQDVERFTAVCCFHLLDV